MAALPDVVPLFPLPNVVLFPGVPLPLHVFEPRYRSMVRDVAGSPEPLIGVVLLRAGWEREYAGRPPIFSVGSAGRLVRLERLADGRANILLHGLREFTVVEELGGAPYRRARVTWRPPAERMLPPALAARTRALLARVVARLPGHPGEAILRRGGLADALVVNFFAQTLFTPVERQALLEAETAAARAERLCDLLEFALHGGVAGPAPRH